MPDHIKKSMEKHQQVGQSPAVRLGYVIGFLAGSLATKRAMKHGPKKFLEWCEECDEESREILAEFDGELRQDLDQRRNAQGN